jgi:hypothetical protein
VTFVPHDRDGSRTAAFDEVFGAGGARIIRAVVQPPRMNSIMERRVASCRRELLDRTPVCNQRHLMVVLRQYEDSCTTRRPHRALKQAAPPRQLPDGITDMEQFRVQRRDRAGGVIHEHRLVAQVSGTHRIYPKDRYRRTARHCGCPRRRPWPRISGRAGRGSLPPRPDNSG